MMKRTTVATLVLFLQLAAGSVRAGEPSPEKQFEQAYVTEVIDGKVADAAKVYFTLMNAAKAPARVRLSAKFRFAICAVLLGRADEARAKLDDLLADPDLPPDLKKRVETYRNAAGGIGIGSALDKKLDQLVFELGRADPAGRGTSGSGKPIVPGVYRDFEVIGKPAIPFLRKLLSHPDLSIRRHAYRILLRMNAKGMVKAWTPEISVWFPMSRELGLWLNNHPDRLGPIEAKFLALPDGQLDEIVGHLDYTMKLDEDFVRKAAARLGVDAFGCLSHVASAERRRAIEYDWIRGKDTDLARRTLRSLLVSLDMNGAPMPPAKLFPIAVDRVTGIRQIGLARIDWSGMTVWARTLPVPLVLSQIERLLKPGQGQAKTAPNNSPVVTGLLDALGDAIDGRLGKGTDPVRYEAALKAWIAECDQIGHGPSSAPSNHLQADLAALSDEKAKDLARYVFGDPQRKYRRNYVPALEATDEHGTAVALAALRALQGAHPDAQTVQQMMWRFPVMWQTWHGKPLTDATIETARRYLEMAASLLEICPNLFKNKVLRNVLPLTSLLSPDEAAKRVVALLEQMPRNGVSLSLIPPAVIARCLPEIEKAWSVSVAIAPVAQAAVSRGLDETDRDRLADWVMSHMKGSVSPALVGIVSTHPDVFPPKRWIPTFRPGWVNLISLPREQANAAAKQLAGRDELTDSILLFIGQRTSPSVRLQIATGLYHRTGRALLMVEHQFSRYVSPETVQAALDRTLKGKAPDPALVTALAKDVSMRKPSLKLLPAAKFLLASESKPAQIAGISIARRLGREELLPELVKKLGDVDPDIRDSAKSAMDFILSLRKLKEEAKAQIDQGKGK